MSREPVTKYPHPLIVELLKIRVQHGLTQDDVAKRTGLRNTYVSMIETGRRCPGVTTLVRYAAGVGARIAVVVDPPTPGGAQ